MASLLGYCDSVETFVNGRLWFSDVAAEDTGNRPLLVLFLCSCVWNVMVGELLILALSASLPSHGVSGAGERRYNTLGSVCFANRTFRHSFGFFMTNIVYSWVRSWLPEVERLMDLDRAGWNWEREALLCFLFLWIWQGNIFASFVSKHLHEFLNSTFEHGLAFIGGRPTVPSPPTISLLDKHHSSCYTTTLYLMWYS